MEDPSVVNQYSEAIAKNPWFSPLTQYVDHEEWAGHKNSTLFRRSEIHAKNICRTRLAWFHWGHTDVGAGQLQWSMEARLSQGEARDMRMYFGAKQMSKPLLDWTNNNLTFSFIDKLKPLTLKGIINNWHCNRRGFAHARQDFRRRNTCLICAGYRSVMNGLHWPGTSNHETGNWLQDTWFQADDYAYMYPL